MNRIYKGQTELKLRAKLKLTDDETITGATPVLLKYTKPDGTSGSFTATIEDEFEGIIFYIITSANDIDMVGKWTFWAHITFANSNVAAGVPYNIEVFNEGVIC